MPSRNRALSESSSRAQSLASTLPRRDSPSVSSHRRSRSPSRHAFSTPRHTRSLIMDRSSPESSRQTPSPSPSPRSNSQRSQSRHRSKSRPAQQTPKSKTSSKDFKTPTEKSAKSPNPHEQRYWKDQPDIWPAIEVAMANIRLKLILDDPFTDNLRVLTISTLQAAASELHISLDCRDPDLLTMVRSFPFYHNVVLLPVLS